jgi:hypothetical protein
MGQNRKSSIPQLAQRLEDSFSVIVLEDKVDTLFELGGQRCERGKIQVIWMLMGKPEIVDFFKQRLGKLRWWQ